MKPREIKPSLREFEALVANEEKVNAKINMKTTVALSLRTALAILLIGCTPLGHLREGRISRVNLGMTRQQVIKAIGPPHAESLTNGTNVLVYVEERPGWRQIRITVKLTDNHVTEYGNPAPR